MSGVQESTYSNSGRTTHDQAQEEQEEVPLIHCSSSKDYHTAFSFVISILLALVGVKYQGSGTALFRENRLAFSLFNAALSLYTTALLKIMTPSTDHHHHHHRPSASSNSPAVRPSTANNCKHYTFVFFSAGTSASELLLFILLAVEHPIDFLAINLFVFVFLCALSQISRVAGKVKALEAPAKAVISFLVIVFKKNGTSTCKSGQKVTEDNNNGMNISDIGSSAMSNSDVV